MQEVVPLSFLDPLMVALTGVVLAALLSCLGAAIGISLSAPSIAGAGTAKPETAGKNLVAVIFAEALAIYGLIVSLLSVLRITASLSTGISITDANLIFSAGLAIGIATLFAGIAIGISCSAMTSATVERPELFSKTVVPVIFAEAIAIYVLIIALLMILA